MFDQIGQIIVVEPPTRRVSYPVVRFPPKPCLFPKAPSVASRLKALGAAVDGLLSQEDRAVLDSLPASLAAPKTAPVTPGSFRLMQKIVKKGSGWSEK